MPLSQKTIYDVPVFEGAYIEGENIIVVDDYLQGQIFINGERLGENPILPLRNAQDQVLPDVFSDGSLNYSKSGDDLIITEIGQELSSANRIILRGYYKSPLLTAKSAPFGIAPNKKFVAALEPNSDLYNVRGSLPFCAKIASDARGRFLIPVIENGGLRLIEYNDGGLAVAESVIVGAASQQAILMNQVYFDANTGDYIFPFGVSRQVLSPTFTITSSSTSANVLVVKKNGDYFVKEVQTRAGGKSSNVRYTPLVISIDSGGNVFCGFRNDAGQLSHFQCSNMSPDSTVNVITGTSSPAGAVISSQDNSKIEFAGQFKVQANSGSFQIRQNALETRVDGKTHINLASKEVYRNSAQRPVDSVTLAKNNTLALEAYPESELVVHGFDKNSNLQIKGFSAQDVGFTQLNTGNLTLSDVINRVRRVDFNEKFGMVRVSLPGGQSIVLYNTTVAGVQQGIGFINDLAVSSSVRLPQPSATVPQPSSSSPLPLPSETVAPPLLSASSRFSASSTGGVEAASSSLFSSPSPSHSASSSHDSFSSRLTSSDLPLPSETVAPASSSYGALSYAANKASSLFDQTSELRSQLASTAAAASASSAARYATGIMSSAASSFVAAASTAAIGSASSAAPSPAATNIPDPHDKESNALGGGTIATIVLSAVGVAAAATAAAILVRKAMKRRETARVTPAQQAAQEPTLESEVLEMQNMVSGRQNGSSSQGGSSHATSFSSQPANGSTGQSPAPQGRLFQTTPPPPPTFLPSLRRGQGLGQGLGQGRGQGHGQGQG